MSLSRHSLLSRRFKTRPAMGLKYRCCGARVHPALYELLDAGVVEIRERENLTSVNPRELRRAALAELSRRDLVWLVEARRYLPVFIPPGLHKIARADHGSAVWLPTPELEKLGAEVWKDLVPPNIDRNTGW